MVPIYATVRLIYPTIPDNQKLPLSGRKSISKSRISHARHKILKIFKLNSLYRKFNLGSKYSKKLNHKITRRKIILANKKLRVEKSFWRIKNIESKKSFRRIKNFDSKNHCIKSKNVEL